MRNEKIRKWTGFEMREHWGRAEQGKGLAQQVKQDLVGSSHL